MRWTVSLVCTHCRRHTSFVAWRVWVDENEVRNFKPHPLARLDLADWVAAHYGPVRICSAVALA